MIYLLGLFFWWLRDAVLPAIAIAGGSTLLWYCLCRAVALRHTLVRRGGFVAGGLVAAAFLLYGSRAIWFEFHHPQFAMFRQFVADPIPSSVQELAVDSAAPMPFFDSALVRFRAPADTRAAILGHRVVGSRTAGLAAAVAARFDRDPIVVERLAGPDGGYLRYAPAAVQAFDTPAWTAALGPWRDDQDAAFVPAPTDREVWLYAERGDWGVLCCTATVDPLTDSMTLQVTVRASGWRR